MLLFNYLKKTFGFVFLFGLLISTGFAGTPLQGSRRANITVVCPAADAHVPVTGSHHLASVTCHVTYPKADHLPPKVSLHSPSHDIQLAYGPVSVTNSLTQTRDLVITYSAAKPGDSSSAELFFIGDRGAKIALKIDFSVRKPVA